MIYSRFAEKGENYGYYHMQLQEPLMPWPHLQCLLPHGTFQLPPAQITQSPEEVVDSAMKAMKKRSRPTVFASSKGALILFTLLRMMPRKIVLKIMAQIH